MKSILTWKFAIILFIILELSENDDAYVVSRCFLQRRTEEEIDANTILNGYVKNGRGKHYYVLLNKNHLNLNSSESSDELATQNIRIPFQEHLGDTNESYFKYGDLEVPIRNTLLKTFMKSNISRETPIALGDIEIGSDATVFATPDFEFALDKIFLRIQNRDIPLTEIPKNVTFSSWLASLNIPAISKRKIQAEEPLNKTESQKEKKARQKAYRSHRLRLCYIRDALNTTLGRTNRKNVLKFVKYEIARIVRTKNVTDIFRKMYEQLDDIKFRPVYLDTIKCMRHFLGDVEIELEEWSYDINKVTFHTMHDTAELYASHARSKYV